MGERSGFTLITGASSGIGRALACEFARHGHPLVLIARRRERLEELASQLRAKSRVPITCLTYDLTSSRAVEEICREVNEAQLDIDCLVNNAGIGLAGKFQDHPLDILLKMIDLNVRVPVDLCNRLLPPMLDQRRGFILNVASTGAFQPGPNIAVYYAGKAFLLSFSEALSRELKGSGITVTALRPGSTKSEFHKKAGMLNSRVIRNRRLPSPEEVAGFGYRSLQAGKAVAIHGLMNRLLVQALRFLPRSWVREAVFRLQS